MRIEMSRTIEEKNKALVFQDEVTEEQSESKAPMFGTTFPKPGTQATTAK